MDAITSAVQNYTKFTKCANFLYRLSFLAFIFLLLKKNGKNSVPFGTLVDYLNLLTICFAIDFTNFQSVLNRNGIMINIIIIAFAFPLLIGALLRQSLSKNKFDYVIKSAYPFLIVNIFFQDFSKIFYNKKKARNPRINGRLRAFVLVAYCSSI